MSQVKPKPEGYTTLTPSLVVDNCREAIALYRKVFDAEQIEFIEYAGTTMHAEIRIGDAVLMLADANPQWNLQTPGQLGGSPVSLYAYFDDADAIFHKALDNGFTETMPIQDMFWGDRVGQVVDPYGHMWTLATHIEEVDEAECNRRMAAFAEQNPAS